MARITVEDCLEFEKNRFSLVLLASRRAKAILSGRTPVTDTKGNKAVVSALREIADGKVRFKYPEDMVQSLAIPSERVDEPTDYSGSSEVVVEPGAPDETETH